MWHLKKEVRNEVRDLTALAVSNIALTIYYTSNDLPPLPHFFSQYGIHTKPCFHRINCLCNISSLLLFQVTVGPCKLACFFCCKYLLISSNLFSRRFFKFTRTSFLITDMLFLLTLNEAWNPWIHYISLLLQLFFMGINYFNIWCFDVCQIFLEWKSKLVFAKWCEKLIGLKCCIEMKG